MMIKDVYGVKEPKVYKSKKAFPCIHPSLVVGLELETERCQEQYYYEEYARTHNIIIKQDGSLRGTAFEFITRPMRCDHALNTLQEFFDYAKFNDSNYTDRCSVHVHVNCTDMTVEQVSVLSLLYMVVEELLFDFVGKERADNIYCIPWTHCRNHYDLVTRFLADPAQVMRGWVKYTALNLQPLSTLGTVEFRHMHGTADMAKLTKWLNLIGGLFLAAKRMTMEQLTQALMSLNSTSQYEMFFHSIFGGELEFSRHTWDKMEEGVILAKLGLINQPAPQQVKTPNQVVLEGIQLAGAGRPAGWADIAARVGLGQPDFDNLFPARDEAHRVRRVPLAQPQPIRDLLGEYLDEMDHEQE